MKRKNSALLLACVVTTVLGSCSEPEENEEAVEREATVDALQGASGQPVAEVPIGKVVDWEAEIDNPSADGWDSEVLAEAAKKQLNHLGELIVDPGPADPAELATIVAESFAGDGFVPPAERVFSTALVSVTRQRDESESSPARQGLDEVKSDIDEAEFSGEEVKGCRTKFKVVKVETAEAGFVTEQLVSISWRTAAEIVEQHARWKVRWEGDESPRMQRLEVREFEETRTKFGGLPLFADCTEAVLRDNACYGEQLLHGLGDWHDRIPVLKTLNGIGSPGIALGDVNGDGLDDLYLSQHPRLPNRLFLQNPDGTLRDVSAEWGLDWLEDSRGALLVDLDNDGDRDLAVAMLGHVVLASNRNETAFQIEAVLPVNDSTASLAAADYDRDGRLDLYVCAYAPETTSPQAAPTAAGLESESFVYHDANNSVANSLFRNETLPGGDWRFTDVTVGSGLDVNNRRWSFAAAWEDYDNDGDQDLYVANDYGRNNLYRNDSTSDGVRFVDVAGETGTEDSASGMSVSWGDYNRDGRMDVYVANMFSAAGNRIVPQARFMPNLSDQLRRGYQRFARGNTLLRNLGPEGFDDVSVDAAVTMGRWAWSSNFADINNDGWEDLVVANGYLTGPEDSGDL